MLILLIGDAHITGKNPRARIDNLVQTQFDKWEEVVQLANKHDCPIVSTGDIFNVPILANSLLTTFGEVIEPLKHSLYFVWGNHDLMYHNIDMYARTSLGMLWHNNSNIKHISEFVEDYGYIWDWRDWNDLIQDCGGKLLLIHKAIIDPKMVGGKSSWILNDEEFADSIDDWYSHYDLILCGHWHKKYTFTYKGTKVINPGPLTRRTVDETKVPSIQLINLDTKLSKVIKLQSAKPTHEVISTQHLEANQHQVKTDILDFINALREKKVRYTSSFMDNLILLLDSNELESLVEQKIRQLIADLMERKEI
jgi:predicted phosphodiesterase